MAQNTPVLTRWTYTLTDTTGKDYSFDELKVVSQAALLATRTQLLAAFNRKMSGELAFRSQQMPNQWASIFDIAVKEVSDEDRKFVEEELA